MSSCDCGCFFSVLPPKRWTFIKRYNIIGNGMWRKGYYHWKERTPYIVVEDEKILNYLVESLLVCRSWAVGNSFLELHVKQKSIFGTLVLLQFPIAVLLENQAKRFMFTRRQRLPLLPPFDRQEICQGRIGQLPNENRMAPKWELDSCQKDQRKSNLRGWKSLAN